jgi:hypothetical protein
VRSSIFSRPSDLAAAFVVALAAFAVAGCYNPSIKSGGFKCNTEYMPQNSCPEGFQCSAGRCVKAGTKVDAGVDQSSESKPEVSPDVAPDLQPTETGTDTGPGDMQIACNMPVMGCTADPGKCDPVCQTGCGCHEKCSANALGTLTCNVPLATRARGLGESCDISSLKAASQTDNCAPGLVCFTDSCGARCYQFCKTDADCPMSTCTRDAGGGVKICDVQATTCNPVKNNGQPTGCPAVVQGCYLSATLGDRTVCDCEFMAGGTNASCTIPRDCFPGLTCVGPVGSSVCRPACTLGSTDCGPLSTCTMLNGGKKFGFCN